MTSRVFTERLRLSGFLFMLLILAKMSLFAQDSGTVKGKVIDESEGEPLGSVNILLKGTSIGTITDGEGNFTIANVPTGKYSVIARIVGYSVREIPGVEVASGATVLLNIQLHDESVQTGEVVVYGASMKSERLTEAPSAVSVIEAAEIKLNAVSGQLPKLFETQPGVDIVQSGLNDFNINTRGFNSSLSRRLLVLLDGRDLAIAFLGAQEWNGLSIPVEDLGRMELVRGPASALYGANAFNGVINIQTPPPRSIPGTKVTIAGGDQSSARIDARHAGASGPWSYKMNAGRFQGDTWSVNRQFLQFEYPGFNILNNEEAQLKTRRVASTYGSARVDYEFEDGGFSTAEGGITQVEGEIFVTGIGRVQVPKAMKPWGRLSYSSSSFYAQVWGAGRTSTEPMLSLSAGLPLDEHSFISQGDAQYRTSILDEHLFFIGGLSFRYQTVDTKGTLMLSPRKDNASGVYAQLEYVPAEQWKFVGATRWDRSSLHDDQISPKIAVVWSPTKSHSFRATYNQAFQAPNLSELYLFVLRTATNPYTGLRSFFAYHGNDQLKVEKITGYELGYKGVFGNALFVTLDGYFNTLKDFITDLAPGVHPLYPMPTVLPEDPSGFTRAVWSYSNAGRVHEKGVELGINYYLSDSWIVDANYAFFDFTVFEKSANDVLIPNAPKHKINGGITYRNAGGYQIGVSAKYVPSFDWAAGIYQGPIPAYTLVNVAASYEFTPHLQCGLNVTNLFDREHYQIFGGSFIRKRAIISLTASF